MKVVFATSTSTSSILSSRLKVETALEVEVQSRVIEQIRLWMFCMCSRYLRQLVYIPFLTLSLCGMNSQYSAN